MVIVLEIVQFTIKRHAMSTLYRVVDRLWGNKQDKQKSIKLGMLCGEVQCFFDALD